MGLLKAPYPFDISTSRELCTYVSPACCGDKSMRGIVPLMVQCCMWWRGKVSGSSFWDLIPCQNVGQDRLLKVVSCVWLLEDYLMTHVVWKVQPDESPRGFTTQGGWSNLAKEWTQRAAEEAELNPPIWMLTSSTAAAPVLPAESAALHGLTDCCPQQPLCPSPGFAGPWEAPHHHTTACMARARLSAPWPWSQSGWFSQKVPTSFPCCYMVCTEQCWAACSTSPHGAPWGETAWPLSQIWEKAAIFSAWFT